MSFGSDNQSGASPAVLDALMREFSQKGASYGTDEATKQAEAKLREVFDCDLSAFFVTSGTAANCLALSTLGDPWGAILCHHQAHILRDELTAPEFLTGGMRLVPVAPFVARLDAASVAAHIRAMPDDSPHNIRPQVLSIAQASENGQVYSVSEVQALCDAARTAGLRVHMDGARFANAVAHLGCHPADVSVRAGVDVLCLGATKNGAVAAEAVVFFDKPLARGFAARVKRSGHLLSKGRLLGAQFGAWLDDGHWLNLARHANGQAQRLAAVLSAIQGVRVALPPQANEVFAVLPRDVSAQLTAAGIQFSPWYDDAVLPDSIDSQCEMLARFVTSFATTDDQIEAVAKLSADVGPIS